MREEVDLLNVDIVKVWSRLRTLSTLDGEQLSTTWGDIELSHDRIQELTQSLTTTVETLGKIFYQANKRASDADSNAYEVKTLGASSSNEIKIPKATINQINSRVRST